MGSAAGGGCERGRSRAHQVQGVGVQTLKQLLLSPVSDFYTRFTCGAFVPAPLPSAAATRHSASMKTGLHESTHCE